MSKVDPRDCVWSSAGWEDASEDSVQSAHDRTRRKAAAEFAASAGVDRCDVRVWRRHIIAIPLQELWEDYGIERWEDHFYWDEVSVYGGGWIQLDGDLPDYCELDPPREPPPDWEPDEDDPSWRFVHSSHPDAVAVFICGTTDDDPPQDPADPARTAG